MARITGLNAHEAPPEAVRLRYKQYMKISPAEVNADPTIVDLQSLDSTKLPNSISLQRKILVNDNKPAFDRFVIASEQNDLSQHSIPVYTHRSVTGLLMVPSLFPPAVQMELLTRLFHRDLSNSAHKTNLHLHYNVTYPVESDGVIEHRDTTSLTNGSSNQRAMSFFEDSQTRTISPIDLDVHKPLTVQNVLNKKLRWVTLGGQYDWTAKVYPNERPPAFPEDIAELLRAAFPQTEPEAAILNLYSPGNTLSPHRDVSEECDAGLISVSFGCDGLFLIGHDDGAGCEIIRLRSGDAVYMDGTSRFAWHAVPKILPETCPPWLVNWPCIPGDVESESRFADWKGWMAGKRVNLNVRQMVAEQS
ncbi:oxidoreductase, 2OG-Fe(II) oxygenase family [Aspergillus stella-maris]|uniref:oxidoreductase, 2OG-Fe(II) oxygenase family n=1 Tax=Aspergillus stella-maris TaxID=1810926 RepID=UPI003CCD91C4